jgi:RNA polymerase sigma-70 factor (family 1)
MEHGIKMALSFQRGEQEGFEYFFNKLFDGLAGYANRFLQDREAASDIAEHAFMKIWERRETFNHHLVIQDYLYVIVKNECLRLFDKQKTVDKHEDGYNNYEINRLSDCEADQTLIKSEAKAIVHNWLKQLPAECGKIMKLMYVDGLSAKEIANHLHLHISTVKGQKSNGLEFIKAINEGKYKKNEVRTQLQPPPELAKIVFIEVPKTPSSQEDKPVFIPWKNRKKGRPKLEQEREWKWKPSERNELIYEMSDNGMSLSKLSDFFELKVETLSGIIGEERKSVKMKQLFLKGRNAKDIARITKVSLKEAIERLNYIFKIDIYAKEIDPSYATHSAYLQDHKSIPGKEGAGDINGLEAKYG